MTFNFSFMFSKFSASRFKAEVGVWERAVGDKGGWPAYFLSNHDYPRHISRYARARWTVPRAKVAAAMLLTLRGTPFLYQGEEIGMRNVWLRKWEVQDPVGKKYWPFHPGRDGGRTPMQWNAGRNAGFSNAEPWLRVHPNHTTVNVETEEDDPDSLLNFYKKLIWVRKSNPALMVGDYSPYVAVPDGVFSYFREAEGQTVFVALNFTKKNMHFSVKIKGARNGKKIFSSPDLSGDSFDFGKIELAPYGVLIAFL